VTGVERLLRRGGKGSRFRVSGDAGAALGEPVMGSIIDSDIDAHFGVPSQKPGETFSHAQDRLEHDPKKLQTFWIRSY